MKDGGWSIQFIMERNDVKNTKLNKDNFMSIDLGVKRTATTFNSQTKEVITYNGKSFMASNQLRNKFNARIESKKSQYKKGSRKHKRISQAKRRVIRKIKNKEKDILHNYSRTIVNDAIANNIGMIIIGDNSNTHNETNMGKIQNQKIQQNPEQKLRKYIEYKFERVGGTTKVVPEKYTSRDCPKCDGRKKSSPKGRVYSCGKCKFTYDRDGVGSLNIMKINVSNVSFDHSKWLDVIGGLTPPRGVKYHPQLSLIHGNKITSSEQLHDEVDALELVSSASEEPHVL